MLRKGFKVIQNTSQLQFTSFESLDVTISSRNTPLRLSVCNLFPKLKSGYRKSYSTETTLLRLQNDLLRSTDTGNEALLILLDFSAAFDTINHAILFCLLHRRFGLSGTVFDWIASFFHHRRYFVSTGKYSSKHHPL